MPGTCVFHCLNFKLVSEWLGSSSEYLGYLRRPFQAVPLRQLWRCNQSDWEAAFREWGIIQLWLGIVSAILYSVAIVLDGGDIVNYINAAIEFVVRVVVAYFFAHLGWFGAVRKGGCCCCLVACFEGPLVLLLLGAFAVCWGILVFLGSLQILSVCSWCFINAILAAMHGVTLLYMGICSLHLWRKHGAEIAPATVQVQGPEGQVVGAAEMA